VNLHPNLPQNWQIKYLLKFSAFLNLANIKITFTKFQKNKTIGSGRKKNSIGIKINPNNNL
jgi:hypothetical protein